MIMRSLLLVLLGLFSGAGGMAAESTALARLATCLNGNFANAEQAKTGQEDYQSAILHVTTIWAGRTDGPWLYVEQSLAEAPTHPYRQRVYQLVARADGALEYRIFELPDPVTVTGAWENPALLAKLTPAGLLPRAGCTIILHPQPDGSFKGGSEGRGCASDLPDAAYATSEVTITGRQIITWDRGYNAGGTQVWGSVQGGYVFTRIE
jgi:CpeT protein